MVTAFTVSHSFETFRNGSKSTHFVSFNFTTPEPVTQQMAELLALRASIGVTKSAIQQAVARGHLSMEEGGELVSTMKGNHELLLKKKLEKVG